MTSPKIYSVLDNKVYGADFSKAKDEDLVRNGTLIKNGDEQYLVMNTVDTNDKSNRSGYTQIR